MGKNLEVDSDSIKDCDPIITNKDLEFGYSIDRTPLDPDAAAFPCGLVAKSYFNDTFTIYSKDPRVVETSATDMITINDDDIAWESDVKHKFFNMEGPNDAYKKK